MTTEGTSDLRITVIQSSLHWHQPDANRAMFEEKIWQANSKTDIIVLPEMFTTGFSMDAIDLAETMNGPTHKWMKQIASQMDCCITGSIICKENGNVYNRLLWVMPDGKTQHYDKKHLFSMVGEDEKFSSGNDLLIVTYKGWRICPLICYDLRFPVWSRNVHDNQLVYDLLIYVANWPNARIEAWETLLKARAIENLSYCVGVNRIGEDGNNILYSGSSMVVSPKGKNIWYNNESEEIFETELSYESLINFRKKFPAQLDADKFTIIK
ncbi:amidohydrolase [Marinigracilibium pacificum]|uniref:Omega-amidase YafV n=1 Tax=Marinigracilibium pacificum TaxID=2729599 RepID=A0A848IRT6_9BACT|nr:amidohydrolase [Marinigracilibium pacificum]NMM47183.1 amidohydrolase [Marinigracilibium pacificum]